MADCVSLPHSAELVGELKTCASDCSYLQNSFDLHNGSIMFRAADAIEQLIAENANLKAKLDAAIKDIPKHCGTCYRLYAHETCYVREDGSCGWEWRGAQDG